MKLIYTLTIHFFHAAFSFLFVWLNWCIFRKHILFNDIIKSFFKTLKNHNKSTSIRFNNLLHTHRLVYFTPIVLLMGVILLYIPINSMLLNVNNVFSLIFASNSIINRSSKKIHIWFWKCKTTTECPFVSLIKYKTPKSTTVKIRSKLMVPQCLFRSSLMNWNFFEYSQQTIWFDYFNYRYYFICLTFRLI